MQFKLLLLFVVFERTMYNWRAPRCPSPPASCHGHASRAPTSGRKTVLVHRA